MDGSGIHGADTSCVGDGEGEGGESEGAAIVAFGSMMRTGGRAEAVREEMERCEQVGRGVQGGERESGGRKAKKVMLSKNLGGEGRAAELRVSGMGR